MALVESGLLLKLEGLARFTDGLEQADQAIETIADNTDIAGERLVKFSTTIAGIDKIIDAFASKLAEDINVRGITSSLQAIGGTLDTLAAKSDVFLAALLALSTKTFKIEIDVPNLAGFSNLNTLESVFDALKQRFETLGKALDSTGVVSKLNNFIAIFNNQQGILNIATVAGNLKLFNAAMSGVTRIKDFQTLAPRLESLSESINKFGQAVSISTVVSVENLAKAIPPLVSAFRSLANSKNLPEFIKRIEQLIPVFDKLSKTNFGDFANTIRPFSQGLLSLINVFKQLTTGKKISELPKLLPPITDALERTIKTLDSVPLNRLTNITVALETISRSFRNFGLAVKNFASSSVSLNNVVDSIVIFANRLDNSLNLSGFVAAVTDVANVLAKLARAVASFTRNKNITELPQRFEDIRKALLALASLNLETIAATLNKIAEPLKNLNAALGTIARSKDLAGFGIKMKELGAATNSTFSPLNLLRSAVGSLGPVFSSIGSAIGAFATQLLRLPLNIVIFNLKIFRAIFIGLPIAVVTGLFNGFVRVLQLLGGALRLILTLLGGLANAFLKIITLGGSLTQIFSFMGAGKTNQNLRQINQSLNETNDRLIKTTQSATQINTQLNQTGHVVQQTGNRFSGFAAGLTGAGAGLTAVGAAATALNVAKMVLFGNSVQGLTLRILSLVSAYKTLQVAGGLVTNVFNRLQFGLRSVLGSALESTIAFEKLQLSVSALTAREMVQAGGFESMQQALPAANERAQELIVSLQQLAIISPFSVSDVQQAFTLAQAYGFLGDEALDLTEKVVDFLSATGQSGEVGEGVVRAAGQIKALGRVASQELNQLAERGINLRQILADSLGITVPEVLDLVSKGAISAEVGLAALNKFLNEFDGSAERASETVGGLIASIGDLKDASLRQAFVGLFEALKPFASELVSLLQGDDIKVFLQDISDTVRITTENLIQGVAKPIGFVISAIRAIPEPVKNVIAEFAKFAAVTAAVTLAFTVFKASLLIAGAALTLIFNPIGLLVGAAIGLSYVIASNADAFKTFGESVVTFAGAALEFILTKLVAFAGVLVSTGQTVNTFISSIQTLFSGIDFSPLTTAFETIATKGGDAFNALLTLFGNGFSKILTIIGDAGNNISTFFTNQIGDLTEWGSATINAFAEGILSALTIVADALQQLGSVIAFWLQPGSPPRIVPNIDKWGRETAQEYLDGFGQADFNTIRDFSSTFETLLKSLDVDPAAIKTEQVVTDFANLIASIKQGGEVETGFLDAIAERTGKASGEVQRLVEAYISVEEQTLKARDATKAYEDAIAAAKGELDGFDDTEKFSQEEKRIKNLEQRLENRFLTEEQKQATIREIEKINAERRLRQLKSEKDAQEAILKQEEEALATEKARLQLASQFQNQGTGAGGISAGGAALSSDTIAKGLKGVQKTTDAFFKYQLAIADTAGKIELYRQRLSEVEEGSDEYYDILTKISQLEQQRNKELERANKGGAGALSFDTLVDPKLPTQLSTLTKQISEPLEQFKKTMDDAKKRFKEVTKDITDRFDAIRKRFEEVGLTGERLQKIALAIGAAFAGFFVLKPVVAILGIIATLASPLLAVGAAIVGVALGFKLFKDKFDFEKTYNDVKNFINVILGLGGVITKVFEGFTSGKSLFEALFSFDTSSVSGIAGSLAAIAGSILQQIIAFQTNLLETIGRIALGANPIDAILSSFLNVEYEGVGAAILARLQKLFTDIVAFIVSIPQKFASNLADTDGGFAGIITAAAKTLFSLLTKNPLVDLLADFLTFDLSNVKINIGGIEFSGGKDLGKKLSELLNSLFNTNKFNFLQKIDFSTPLSVIFSTLAGLESFIARFVSRSSEQLQSLIPYEVYQTLQLVKNGFNVLAQAVAAFQSNFQAEGTAESLQKLGQAALFVLTQIGKLLGFVAGATAGLATLLGVGILPELPRIIGGIADALTALFNFVGNSIQTVIDFILAGNFSLESFGKLISILFGDASKFVTDLFSAFSRLQGILKSAVENLIRFFGVEFGFDADAVITQFSTLLTIVGYLSDAILLLFGGIAVKLLLGFSKKLSFLALVFKPLIVAAKTLLLPFTALANTTKRLYNGYLTLGRGMALLRREKTSLFKSTKGLFGVLSDVFAVVFKGRTAYGALVKPTSTLVKATRDMNAALNGTATVAAKAPGFFTKLLGVITKFKGPLGLIIGGFTALSLLFSAGMFDGLLKSLSELTNINFDNLSDFSGLGAAILGAAPFIGTALGKVFENVGPYIAQGISKISPQWLTSAFTNLFSKINFSTVLTVFSTFPGLFLRIFNPSNFKGILTFFTSTFSKIGGIIKSIFPIILRLGAIFIRIVPFLTNPIGLIIGAVTVLAAAWYNNWFNIREITQKAIDWIFENVPKLGTILLEWIAVAVEQTPILFASWISSLIGWLGGIGTTIGEYSATFGETILSWIQTAIALLPDKIRTLIAHITLGLIVGSVAMTAAALTLALRFFSFVSEAIVMIPEKLGQIWTAISDWITNTLIPAFQGEGSLVGSSFMDSISTFFSGVGTVLGSIGQIIIDGIIAGVNLALENPLVAAALQPMIDAFTTFIDGDSGLAKVIRSVYDNFNQLAIDIVTIVWANPFEEITAFINGEQGILTTIASIVESVQNFVLTWTGIDLPNPFSGIASFIEGEGGVIDSILAVKSNLDTLKTFLSTLVFLNPFTPLIAAATGKISITEALKTIQSQFTILKTAIVGIVFNNPFAPLINIITGENGLIILLGNIVAEFNGLVTSLTGITLPNPFFELQNVLSGESSIGQFLESLKTAFTQFVTDLAALVIPNIFAGLTLALETLTIAVPGLKPILDTLISGINSITITDIFAPLVSGMTLAINTVQPVIDGFTKVKDFFAGLTLTNPFANIEIPDKIKTVLRVLGVDLGENTGEGVAEGFNTKVSSELTNADLQIGVSSGTVENAKAAGAQIGTNVIEGVKEGAEEAVEDEGWFGGVGKSISDGFTSFFGIKSPSTLTRDTIGLPIGQGILLGIEQAFQENEGALASVIATITARFDTFGKFLQESVNTSLLGVSTVFISFLSTLTTEFSTYTSNKILALQTFQLLYTELTTNFFVSMTDQHINFYQIMIELFTKFSNDLIKLLVAMVDAFIKEIKRLVKEVIDELRKFLKAVEEIMKQFVEIMRKAAKDGVDAFVNYIKDNFADQATAAFKGAFGQFLADIKEIVEDGGAQAGEEFIKGLIRGMEDSEDDLYQTIRKIGEQLLIEFRRGLQIQSPSKRAANEIGLPFIQGIGQGLLSNIGILSQSVNSVVDKVFNLDYTNIAQSFAKNQILDPISETLNQGLELAQNVNLRYNGQITSLPELWQTIGLNTSANFDLERMQKMQAYAAASNTSNSRYVTSNSERHYHMHMNVTPKQAMNVRRNFSVAQHLGIN